MPMLYLETSAQFRRKTIFENPDLVNERISEFIKAFIEKVERADNGEEIQWYTVKICGSAGTIAFQDDHDEEMKNRVMSTEEEAELEAEQLGIEV